MNPGLWGDDKQAEGARKTDPWLPEHNSSPGLTTPTQDKTHREAQTGKLLDKWVDPCFILLTPIFHCSLEHKKQDSCEPRSHGGLESVAAKAWKEVIQKVKKD